MLQYVPVATATSRAWKRSWTSTRSRHCLNHTMSFEILWWRS